MLHFSLTQKRLLYVGKIIVTTANYWKRYDYFAGSRDDLISEGWMVLFKVMKECSIERPIDLYKLVASSCQRRFIDISRRRKTERKYVPVKGEGYQNLVDNPIAGYIDFGETHLKELTMDLSQNLSDFQKEVLVEKVFPSVKTEDIALKDYRRRKSLRNKGYDVKGCGIARIKDRHIAKALGVPDRKIRDAVARIKKVCMAAGIIPHGVRNFRKERRVS